MVQRITVITLLLFIFYHAKAQESEIPSKDFKAYLFTYFISNAENAEAVRYAVSLDGYNYYTLNNNKPILDSKKISEAGGIRDPHILRKEDGHSFYMVGTDMMASNGWDSNRGMVLMKSDDLVHWETSAINIQKRFEGHEDLKRVWAPQTIFDENAGKYLIYFSMKHGDGPDIIYYAYANEEFTDLEHDPKPFFIPETKLPSIDGDIVYKDSTYYLFYKTETDKPGIKMAMTQDLTSDEWTEYDEYLQQTDKSVEGSGIFKLNHSDEYIMMYDVYRDKEYQFTRSKDLKHFEVIDDEISMDFHPRHGTIMPITRSELRNLLREWGIPYELPTISNNPVLEGYYADPEIIYSEKEGKYFLYPTSDGFDSWSGHYFETFSSEDLVHWKNEGVILDLKKDVSWTDRNAWAPCAIEKKIDEEFKYFYYFTAAQQIGVAVADDPAGPFKDIGKPLIDFKPEGINRGQEIDPDIFEDPVSGKNYLYWGNGYMAVVELNKDMISFDPSTLKVLNTDHTFREGTEVFYRNGTYYFMWSEDDTRSPNYRVRYATADNPLGPLNIQEGNLVIEKDESQGIFGTGHNSVINVPGTDDWYIVYHRFNYPDGIKMGRPAGFHREVCIDRMEFDEEGKIKKITPTHRGIKTK